ncbi:MAG TPA: bifunctional YncE family protein/alkaline phosphatase family protein [Pyrinomonadaceae bacterium]
MNRKIQIFAAIFLLSWTTLISLTPAQDRKESRVVGLDEPEDEEDLNSELWEFAKKTPYAEALRYIRAAQQQSQATRMAEAALPNGWKIAPAGAQIEVGRLPYQAIPFAGRLVVLNTGYYTREPQEVSVVDVASSQVVKTIRLNSLFPSATVSQDGDLYISGGFDQKVFRLDSKFNVVREYKLTGYVGGLAAVDAKRVAVVYLAANNAQNEYIEGRLVLLNTETGTVEKEIKVGYFPYTVRYINGKLYLTLLGQNKLLVYDAQLNAVASLATGQTPQEMCSDDKRLYVVNTNSDDISVVDTATNRIVSTIGVRSKASRFGVAPTSCAVDGNHLYVTLAGTNAVALFDKNKRKREGLIPTGWYPTKVLYNEKQLLVLSAKGVRSRRPNLQGPQPVQGKGGNQYVLTLLKGSLSVIPKDQIKANQAAWTRQVETGSPLYSPAQGLKLPIQHVFYIIKENRTYDQVFGDLRHGNGDPSLTIFGRDVTPNHHALAEGYVTLDNFYADGEISVLGHSFTTSGYASPFQEWLGNASYSGRFKGYPFGTVPAVTSPAYLWDEMDARGVDYRIYGENYFLYTTAFRIIREVYGAESEVAHRFYDRVMALSTKGDRGNEFYAFAQKYYGQANTPADALRLLEKPEFAHALSLYLTADESIERALRENASLRRKFADYLYHYPFNYRSWDLAYSDLDRAMAWKEDFKRQVQANRVAQFQYIWLPNDHTNGASDKLLNPYQFVAQNDIALARIVETISHSPVWRNSLILIEEDDAQNGPDHVDATRTVALAIGPYVKRSAVVSDLYDQISMLRTMELILGLNPLNMNDRLATPMFGIFTDKPDFTPYVATQASKHLTEEDRKRDERLSQP